MILLFLAILIGVLAKGRLSNQELSLSHAPALQPLTLPTPEPTIRPKFNPTFRGCGPTGYSQGYELPDQQTLLELNECFKNQAEAKQYFHQQMQMAIKILETSRPYRHKHFKDEFIQRAIIETVSDGENGKEIKIVYLRDVCVLLLTAPNIELAQEFENTNAWAY